jgi:hypothetical protein
MWKEKAPRVVRRAFVLRAGAALDGGAVGHRVGLAVGKRIEQIKISLLM